MKILKCPVCGNIVEVVEDHGVPMMCCGQKMVEMHANTSDGASEKHVPMLSYDNGILSAVVGSVEHPSTDEHYISFIIATFGNQVMRVQLQPKEKPMAQFHLGNYQGLVSVYAYCNLHGLWKGDLEVA